MADAESKAAAAALRRLVSAGENERVRSSLADDFETLAPLEDVAATLQALVDALNDAQGSVESWTEEEDREQKADARQEAIDMLAEVVTAYEEASGLVDVASLLDGF